MKRFVAILAASGALAVAGAALAPVAFADPANGNANCVGDVASGTQGQLIREAAVGSASAPGPDFLGLAGSTDCGTR